MQVESGGRGPRRGRSEKYATPAATFLLFQPFLFRSDTTVGSPTAPLLDAELSRNLYRRRVLTFARGPRENNAGSGSRRGSRGIGIRNETSRGLATLCSAIDSIERNRCRRVGNEGAGWRKASRSCYVAGILTPRCYDVARAEEITVIQR